MTKIISGFPGVGKSVICQDKNKYGWRIIDSDSSTFSWVKEGIRNPEFPTNYINFISGEIGFARIVMVSSHDVVREALRSNEINYTLVYPDITLKDEYLERYVQRGNSKAFINFIDSNWNKFITDIENETFPKLIKLKQGEFLSDVLSLI